MMENSSPAARIVTYRERIIDEVCFALGVGRSGLARRALGPLFRAPAGHFARIVERLEAGVAEGGLSCGAQRILGDFSLQVQARGAGAIPPSGPLVLACNHPGAYDSVGLAANIPRRDLQIMASDVPFTRAMTETGRYLIYTPADSTGRLAALRQGLAHLQAGGALLVFARAEVEPDPAVLAGASETIGLWSRSLEALLRKVPQAALQIVISSGLLAERYLRSPWVRLRRQPFHQQKLAETMQILDQMVSRSPGQVNMRVSFGPPLAGSQLPARAELMPEIIRRARALLAEHVAEFGGQI